MDWSWNEQRQDAELESELEKSDTNYSSSTTPGKARSEIVNLKMKFNPQDTLKVKHSPIILKKLNNEEFKFEIAKTIEKKTYEEPDLRKQFAETRSQS